MHTTKAIKAYTNTDVELSVESADSHKLVLMLFQGALLAISNARNQMLRKEIANKGASISKAIAIIESGLHASLDKSVGGELAQNLSSLYEYMCMRLIAANLKNDLAALDEVTRLLSELKGAWESIRQSVTKQPLSHLAQSAHVPKEQLTYGKM